MHDITKHFVQCFLSLQISSKALSNSFQSSSKQSICIYFAIINYFCGQERMIYICKITILSRNKTLLLSLHKATNN